MARARVAMALTLVVAMLTLGCTAYAAQDSHELALKVGFEPYRLGSSTTVSLAFAGPSPSGGVAPSPLRSVALHLPADISYATSSLGLASCDASALITRGAGGCPANSRIGFGTAVVVVPLGPALLQEKVRITTYVEAAANGQIDVLYYASGHEPVIAQLVFPGELSSEASGANTIDTSIPLIATLPGAPDASVIKFESTIGPKGLFYHRNVDGRSSRYHPRGIILPVRCPRGGFRFSAQFHFQDGAASTSYDTVPCSTRAGGA